MDNLEELETKRELGRIDEIDTGQTSLGNNIDETSNQAQDTVEEMAGVKQILGNQKGNQ